MATRSGLAYSGGMKPSETNDRHLSIPARRQRLRWGLMLVWVLLMPITLYWFSPYLPFMGLVEGLVSGSVMVFAGMFVVSLVAGRLFCGWLCPAGAIQDLAMPARPRRVGRRTLQWVKFAIWLPWLGAWTGLAVAAAGGRPDGLRPDALFMLEHGISVSRPEAYIIYLAVLTLILGLALLLGRRGACHAICWMAPFMIIGQGLGRLIRLPGMLLRSEAARCTACGTCNAACPMSLDIGAMALAESTGPAPISAPAAITIAHHDCIFCLRCVDSCPTSVLRPGFGQRG